MNRPAIGQRVPAGFLDGFRQDIRYALRQLVRRPTFTIVVLGTLAIGIGASTAIFSVLKGVFLDPLPYPEPDRLTYIFHGSTDGICCGPLSGPDFRDLRETNRTFADIAVMSSRNTNITGGEHPEMVLGAVVSPGFFRTVGVGPTLGRAFTDEDALGDGRVVILSNAIWRDRFAADSSIVGHTVSLNGESHTVIGVMPPGFNAPSPWRINQMHQVYFPLAAASVDEDRGGHWLLAIGRMRPGVSIEAADADLKSLSTALEEQYPETNFQKTTYVQSMHERLVGRVGTQLWLLFAAAGFMLLIVCGNVASLLLARATGRETEMAIRAAVGAGRTRIIRQLLTENVLLSLFGGAAGVALAFVTMKLLRVVMPTDILRIDEVGIDATVLGFALGVSVLVGILVGLAPALSATRSDLTESLKEGRGSAHGGSHRNILRGTLVVSQFALALVLANGAALMVQSYLRYRGAEQGFDPANVLTASVSLQGDRYADNGLRDVFLRQLTARVAAIPGVVQVGMTSKLPLDGGTNNQVWAEDDPERPPPGGAGPLVEFSRVSADYFQAMGIHLLAGRYLTDDDSLSTAPGSIINQEMARALWPDEDPIGKRFSFREGTPQWITVVGVVENVRQWGPYRGANPENYLPYTAVPERMPRTRMFLIVRTDVDPLSIVGPVRNAVLAVDKEQPLSEIRTMDRVVSEQFAGQRFNTTLAGIFAAVALLLVTAGVYGVVSFHVVRTTHEIGVRMALGAGRGRVLSLTVLRGLRLALIGTAIGVGGIIASTQVIRSLLYGASPMNVPTTIVGVLALISVAIVASLVPAYRAARVSPVTALRGE